jgi:hypothetical protein
MANPEQVQLLKRVEDWNKWRAEHPEIAPDLRDADFHGANLHGANLSGAVLLEAKLGLANLGDADLTGTNLSWADLTGAVLNGAFLQEASLFAANLSSAKLRLAKLIRVDVSAAVLTGADFTGAVFNAVNLTGADLSKADLTDAILIGTNFGDTNLRGAKGLEECTFAGPCVLDIRAILRSGKLPESFLRGCGLPHSLIAYLRSLLSRPIQYFSCFISHSTKDEEFANRLYADLEARDVTCWFAPHDMKGGDRVSDQIDRAIQVHDRVLLILSEASIASKWVETEIRKAFAKEKRENKRVLFPLAVVPFEDVRAWECFDSDSGEDLARKVREYFIPDFSNWKDHDSYQKAFDGLLRDLNAGAQDKATA